MITSKEARINELKAIRKTLFRYTEYTPPATNYSPLNYKIAEATLAIDEMIKLI